MSATITNKSNSSHILYVEKVEEVFFDVFRISFNNEEYVLEGKRINGDPYVKIKTADHGIIPVKLVTGKSKLVLSKTINNKLFESLAVNEIPLNDVTHPVEIPKSRPVIVKEKTVEVKVGSVELFHYIDNQMSKTRDIVRNFVKEAYDLIENKVSNQGTSLIDQFIKEVNNIAPRLENSIKERIDQSYNNLKNNLENNNSELKQEMLSLFERNIEDTNNRVDSFLSTKQTIVEKNIQKTLTALEKVSIETLNEEVISKFNSFKDELKNITADLSTSLNTKENNFESRLEEKCNLFLQTILTKENIFDERFNNILNSITTKENQLEEKINDKYSIFRELVNELVERVKESAIISENKIDKKIKDSHLFVEKKDNFVSKSEMQKLRLEMHNQNMFMRKLIGSMGGGSVAQQFAAGGTMNGTLDVMGNYLSAGQNLMNIFDQRYVPMGMQINLTPEQVQTALTNLGVNTYTATITAASDTWYINHNLDRLNLSINTYTNDIEVMGSERLIDTNNVEITFTMPITGMVVIS